ncbi:TonB family protein [candidate division KSB1 bacterium]|nr:TonB family protein [candidate division KSB1 bacterium]
MTHWFTALSDMRKAVLVSLAAHLLLFILFLFVRVGIDFKPAEFVQVSFISSGRGVQREQPRQTQPIRSVQTPQQSPQRSEPQTTQESRSVPVTLPKRTMLEDEEAIPLAQERQKLTPTDSRTQLANEPVYQERPDLAPQASAGTAGERASAQPMEGGENRPTPPAPVSQSGEFSREPYIIEGEAARRTIIRQEIPQYPPGLQKEALVKIRFTVLPDGTIGRMIPVLKGDPLLEELTMKTLRKWRFNPLPENVQVKNVEGIITFRYELK